MNRSRTAAVALVVFPIQILTGCFANQPVAAPNSSPATNVQVRFTAPSSIAVGTSAASTTIDDVRLVQARVARMAGDTVRLEGIQKIIAAGDWSRLTFDQASFTTSDSVS